ncbi:MAG: hypothetical protein QM755_01765 [Luteolibacter sp.]
MPYVVKEQLSYSNFTGMITGWARRYGFGFLLLITVAAFGQQKKRVKHTFRELADDVYRSLVKKQSLMTDSVFFQRSEESFKQFAGKVVRTVTVQKLGFGESVLDTSRKVISALSRIANNLQTGTKPFIVKQFVFVKEGEAIDPYRLADNERLLRSLDFIKDVRISVSEAADAADSADIVITVRDVFSWGAKADASGFSDFSGTLYDANLFGRAQRLEYTLLYDKDRDPRFGSHILFRKYSLFGSFINADIAYTSIDRGISLGNENETSFYFKLERPLYSPSARFAGGINFSWNKAFNRFEKPDSLYIPYEYRLQDAWLGYNFGIKTPQPGMAYRPDSRRRMFASIRYYDQHFDKKPVLPQYNYLYTNKSFLLGEFRWYKLDFYRTNYIYGFGITEDIPVGFSRKITAGYSKIDSLRRFYLGWQYDHWMVDRRESFYNYTLALGTNYYRGSFQDNSVLFNFSWFSRLFSFRKFRIRQYSNISYAGIQNFTVYDQLRINNEYGIERFNTDSVQGIQRFTAGMETTFFTRWQVLGFKLAFFSFGKASLVAPRQAGLLKGDIYPAVGAGFRMRNENLIFGTVEGRFAWFPRTLDNVDNIKLTLTGNLRFKFPSSFVQAPWFALLK